MKRIKVSWFRIAAGIILVLLLVIVGGMYAKLMELTRRLTYLQDTTDIIQADVGGLESTITQTLQEENGKVEHYSVRILDMDFAADTCRVSVYMIPKEYTDNTRISVFFGTIECPLERDGYAYAGEATLPMEKSYDGNLTFLFADGKKKSTEVYSGYGGVKTYLDEMLAGRTKAVPEYKEQTLSLDGVASYALDGKGLYEFARFELVAEWGDTEIWTKDLARSVAAPNDAGDPQSTQEPSGEAVGLPLGEASGDAAFSFHYEPQEAGQLRLYLRAVTTERYRFEYDLLRVELTEKESGNGREDADEEEGGDGEESGPSLSLDEGSIDRSVTYIVYDKRGEKRVLESAE